jgi:hypothetical protein
MEIYMEMDGAWTKFVSQFFAVWAMVGENRRKRVG